MHHNTQALKRLIPFCMVFYSAFALAGDIACESTQKPAERVICDHAILNWQYDHIYDQQQKLLAAGKVSSDQIASWRLERDACTDVPCINAAFSKWKTIGAADEAGQASSSDANAALLNHAAQAVDPSQHDPGSADAAATTQNSAESQGASSSPESASGAAAEANNIRQDGKGLSNTQTVFILITVALLVWGLIKVPAVRWVVGLLIILFALPGRLMFGGSIKVGKSGKDRSSSKNRPRKDTRSNEDAGNGRRHNPPQTLPSSFKNCATCEHWNGPRKATTFRDRVEFASNEDKGECVGGAFDRSQMTARTSCNKWEKWRLLK